MISKTENMVNFGLVEKRIKNGAKNMKRLKSKNVHTRSYDPLTLFKVGLEGEGALFRLGDQSIPLQNF